MARASPGYRTVHTPALSVHTHALSARKRVNSTGQEAALQCPRSQNGKGFSVQEGGRSSPHTHPPHGRNGIGSSRCCRMPAAPRRTVVRAAAPCTSARASAKRYSPTLPSMHGGSGWILTCGPASAAGPAANGTHTAGPAKEPSFSPSPDGGARGDWPTCAGDASSLHPILRLSLRSEARTHRPCGSPLRPLAGGCRSGKATERRRGGRTHKR